MEFKTLQELCTEIIDCPHTTPEWKTEGIPVIRNYNLQNGFIDKSKLSFVDNDTYLQRIKRGMPQVDDIIFSREAPVGSVAIMPSNFRCCLGQRLVLLKVNKSICDPHYLLYVMLSNFVKKQYKTVEKTGSIVSNFNIGDLKNLVIPYVDIAIQKKIGKMCGMLDRKIAVNNLTIENLESMAKTLYDYWFVQFDFPDANGNPYKTSGGKMEWNETLSREIPAGWEVGRLADYCSLQRGVTYGKGDSTNIPQDGYVPILRANNIQNHELNFDSLVYLPKKLINEKQYLKNGEILIAMSSGSMEHIGKVARVFYDLNYGFGAFCSKITPLKDTGKQYVYYYVISDEFQLYIHNMCLGTNIRNLTNDHILNSKLCKIPEKILSQFESKMAPIHKKQALLKQENINLSYIRDFLLPMLMNGQVTFRQ